MKNPLSFHILGVLILFVISCEKEELPPADLFLSVTLTASSDKVTSGDIVELSINIYNAESLFAVAFELNFDPELFELGASGDTIIIGNLFSDPFPENLNAYLVSGEVSVGFAQWGDIKKTASGIACNIILSAKNSGTGAFYISSIDMIKKDGSNIMGYPPIIEFLEVEVFE